MSNEPDVSWKLRGFRLMETPHNAHPRHTIHQSGVRSFADSAWRKVSPYLKSPFFLANIVAGIATAILIPKLSIVFFSAAGGFLLARTVIPITDRISPHILNGTRRFVAKTRNVFPLYYSIVLATSAIAAYYFPIIGGCVGTATGFLEGLITPHFMV